MRKTPGFVPDHAAEDAAVNDALRGEVDVNGRGHAGSHPAVNNGSGSNGSVGHEGSKGGGRVRENAIGDVTLEVDRVAMAKSGSLLLLFRDPHGTLDRMRRALRGAFPGAPAKQTTIAHCTLLRCFPGVVGWIRFVAKRFRISLGPAGVRGRQRGLRAVDAQAGGREGQGEPGVARA